MAHIRRPVPKLFKLFNTLGLLPFELKETQLVLSRFGVLRFTTIVSTNASVCFLLLYQTVLWNRADRQILGPIVTYVCLAFNFGAMLGAVHQIASSKQRARLARLFSVLDSCTTAFPIRSSDASVFNYAHVKMQLFVLLAYTAVLVNSLHTAAADGKWGNFSNLVCWVLCQYYFNYLSLPFHCLLKVLELTLESLTMSICTAHNSNAIAKAVRAYDSLSISVGQLNCFYGFTLLCCIAVGFLSSLSSLFYSITVSPSMYSVSQYIGNLATCVSTVVYVYSLVKSGDIVVEKAGQFSKLLASRALHDDTGKFADNPSVVMHFASWKKMEFNICNCFNLNLRLGCSMLAAGVTYLVIMVQMNPPAQ